MLFMVVAARIRMLFMVVAARIRMLFMMIAARIRMLFVHPCIRMLFDRRRELAADARARTREIRVKRPVGWARPRVLVVEASETGCFACDLIVIARPRVVVIARPGT